MLNKIESHPDSEAALATAVELANALREVLTNEALPQALDKINKQYTLEEDKDNLDSCSSDNPSYIGYFCLARVRFLSVLAAGFESEKVDKRLRKTIAEITPRTNQKLDGWQQEELEKQQEFLNRGVITKQEYETFRSMLSKENEYVHVDHLGPMNIDNWLEDMSDGETDPVKLKAELEKYAPGKANPKELVEHKLIEDLVAVLTAAGMSTRQATLHIATLARHFDFNINPDSEQEHPAT